MLWVCITVEHRAAIASSGRMACHLCCAMQNLLILLVYRVSLSLRSPHGFHRERNALALQIAPRNLKLNGDLSHYETSHIA